MKRTTHRSKTGAKRYLVHGADGKIKDNQSYRNAHRRDLATKSVAERTVKGWAYLLDTGRVLLAWGGNRDGARGVIRCTITLHEPTLVRAVRSVKP